MIKISVEGNIGSGKTTLLDHFVSHPSIEPFYEPVAKWQNLGGHNLLDLMYSNPLRWTLAFQSYAQLTMVRRLEEKSCGRVKLMERSLFSGRYCFMENFHSTGAVAEEDFVVLDDWFDWIVANVDCQLDLIVYLNCHPQTSLERIRQRGREEEKSISLGYLTALGNLHDDWLIRKKFPSHGAQVYQIDANVNLVEMRKCYDQLECYITELCARQD